MSPGRGEPSRPPRRVRYSLEQACGVQPAAESLLGPLLVCRSWQGRAPSGSTRSSPESKVRRGHKTKPLFLAEGGFRIRPLTDAERNRLQGWSRRKLTPYRLVIRSRIVLFAANGLSHREIASTLGVRTVTVTRWLRRFALLGTSGLLRDAPRSTPRRRLSDVTIRSIVTKTFGPPPVNGRYWSTRTLAREIGVSHTSVRRVWQRFGIRPHSSRIVQLSHGSVGLPQSIDVSGVFFAPPRWAVTLCLGRPEPSGSRRSLKPLIGGSPVRGGARAPGQLSDLAACVGLMRHRNPRGSWLSLIDQEFRAFLGRLAERHRPEERILLVTGPDGPSSESTSRWLDAHPQISWAVLSDPGSLTKSASIWIEKTGRHRPLESGLPSLPRLRHEIQNWADLSGASAGPFAWLRD